MSIRLLKSVILSGLMCSAALADQRIVIHEWGTFTSLQNDKGEAIGGINIDTELLPAFVHNFAPAILPNQAPIFQKGMPTAKPRLDVTMRLETPVVYFHLSADAPRPTVLDLSVRFPNGWLTQFYPDAAVDIDGRPVTKQPLGPILPATAARKSGTTGGLTWQHLQVGTDRDGPSTKAQVWLAPRQVHSDRVTTNRGESEQYIFYRGVGHLDAPLRVLRTGENELEIRADAELAALSSKASISKLWLVDVAPEGALAFHSVGPMGASGAASSLRIPASFAPSEHSTGALDALQGELRQALIADGLFEDEANALLKTWQSSYFHQAGTRLFFLVPHAWTDAHLPMTVSVPCTIHRSMVGRIELVTPAQRKILHDLAAVKTDLPDPAYFRACGTLYGRLGRFANALLLDEQKSRPNEGLATYIKRAKLDPFALSAPGQASAR